MTRGDRLGRGISALMDEYLGSDSPDGPGDAPQSLPVAAIASNPYQPRKDFRAEELSELAASLNENGLIQPIVVRNAPDETGYQLIAGERRLRAAQQLGWTKIAAMVRRVDDRTLLVLALVENVQRQDLGPIAEAAGYGALRDDFGYTQAEIAKAVGKSRSTVANMLRLLALPEPIRAMVEAGELSKGHARALLAVEDPKDAEALARRAAAEDWSVRDVEARVRRTKPAEDGQATPDGDEKPGQAARDPALDVMEEALAGRFATRVAIRWRGRGRGDVRIQFHGAEDLERVFEALTGKPVSDVLD